MLISNNLAVSKSCFICSCPFQIRLQQIIDGNVEIVKPSDGGGSRLLNISKEEDPNFDEIITKAINMYFPDGIINQYATMYGYNQNKTQKDEKVRNFLQKNGLYASRTWFFLRTRLNENRSSSSDETEHDEFPHPLKRRRKTSKPKVECPICYQKFEREVIESHAGTCKLSFEEVDSDEEYQYAIQEKKIKAMMLKTMMLKTKNQCR